MIQKNLPFKGRSFRIPIVIPGTGLWLAGNKGIGLHSIRALAFRFREVSRFVTPGQGCGRV